MRSLALLLLPSLLGGCALSVGDEGERGELTFSAPQDGIFSCLFDCDVEGDLMVGGVLDVVVTGGDPMDTYRVRALPASSATVSISESFSCDSEGSSGSSSRSVMRRDGCTAGETLSTTRTISVTPSVRGHFDVQVLDGAGEVVDSIELGATDASRVTVLDPSADGKPARELPVVVGVNETVAVAFGFVDENGADLLVSRLAAGSTVAPRDAKITLDTPVLGAISTLFSGEEPMDLTGKASGPSGILFTLPGRVLDVAVEVR